ncbi:hypothetical protein DFJ73DRAFT_964035 [Zopfochytrium polystomum]|nr:hypothetical protein DFJ73DRAFT_964035 [Zopfochytrium polystomum]
MIFAANNSDGDQALVAQTMTDGGSLPSPPLPSQAAAAVVISAASLPPLGAIHCVALTPPSHASPPPPLLVPVALTVTLTPDAPPVIGCEAWSTTMSPTATGGDAAAGPVDHDVPFTVHQRYFLELDTNDEGGALGSRRLVFRGKIPVARSGHLAFSLLVREKDRSTGGIMHQRVRSEWIDGGKTAIIHVASFDPVDHLRPSTSFEEIIELVEKDGWKVQEVTQSKSSPCSTAYQFWLVQWNGDPSATPFFRARNMHRHVLLERANPFWLRPRTGGSSFMEQTSAGDETNVGERRSEAKVATANGDVHLTLVERTDGRTIALVPFPPSALRPGGTNTGSDLWGLRWDEGAEDPHGHGLIVGLGPGKDTRALLDGVADSILQYLGESSGDRPPASLPETATSFPPSQIWDRFAWCTWDAFYTDINRKKIIDGVDEFRRLGVTPEVVLIDDGWQQYNGLQQLYAMEPDPSKFPDGLGVCRALKDKGVKYVGVWHTLIGYWGGIDPSGPIAQKYKLTEIVRGSSTLHVVDASDIGRFYEDYHQYLRNSGVDFIKVDHQSFFDEIRITDGDRLWRAYQAAMIEQAQKMPAVWCMSHTPHVIFDSILGKIGSGRVPVPWQNAIRSSDDFFPNIPESHANHVYANALNALLLGTLARGRTLLDWDMFHSEHRFSWFHAAARAVSGGPVYVSDRPGSTDGAVIRALTAAGRSLRCRGLPAGGSGGGSWPDDPFTNPTRERALLQVRNTNFVRDNGNGGQTGAEVVGVFNCGGGGDSPLSGWVHPSLGDSSEGGSLLAVFGRSGAIQRVPASTGCGARAVPVDLGFGEAEVISFVRLLGAEVGISVACLGLLGKLNGTAAVESSSFHVNGDRAQFSAWLWSSGLIGLYIDLPTRQRAGRGAEAAAVRVSSIEVDGFEWVGGGSVDGFVWVRSSTTKVVPIDAGPEAVRRVNVVVSFNVGKVLC